MKKANIISSILCLILSAFAIIIAKGFPASQQEGVPGPAVWPTIISILLAICAIWLLVESFISKKPEFEEKVSMLDDGSKRVYISMAILIVYFLVTPKLGFLLSTSVMMLIFVKWFSKKNIFVSLAISVGTTVIIYFIFRHFLNVPLDFGLIAF